MKKRNRFRKHLLGSTFIVANMLSMALATSGASAEVKTIASIKPLHSLLAGVTEGVSTPNLVIDGNASPHHFSLKPSQLKSLNEADFILWIGHNFERFLERPIETLEDHKSILEVEDIKTIIRHKLRESDGFEPHQHHDHDDEKDHDDDDKHDHEKKDHDHEHDHDDKDKDEHDHDKDHDDDHAHKNGHDAHDHEGDNHFWLSPKNAKIIVQKISKNLQKIDPENKSAYEKNTVKMLEDLEALDAELKTSLTGLQKENFLVFHDAYQYFEKHYDFHASGSITISPELPSNAARVKKLQKMLAEKNISCVFSEPQFSKKAIDVVTEGMDVKVVELDPLGASLKAGKTQYFSLMKNIAASFKKCLAK